MSIFRLASQLNEKSTEGPAAAPPGVVVVHTESSGSVRAGTRTSTISKVDYLAPHQVEALTKVSGTTSDIAASTPATPDGSSTSTSDATDDDSATAPQQLAAALGALTAWLPTEIVAAYAAFTTMIQSTSKDSTPVYSGWIWLIALVATPLTLGITVWAQSDSKTKRTDAERRKLWWTLGLSPVAFVLWSASVPDSAWNILPWFQSNSAIALFALLVVTGLFTLVATKLTGKQPTKPRRKKAA